MSMYWLTLLPALGYIMAGIMTARIAASTVWKFDRDYQDVGWIFVFLFWPFGAVAGFFYLIGKGLHRVVIPRDGEPLFFYKRKPKPKVQTIEEGYPDIIRKQA